jgi:maltose alpha-D-glucosyltransferase / alpha-amylase
LTTIDPTTPRQQRARSAAARPFPRAQSPLWYKNAVIYELHVRAFADSNGDGIGDFPGLTSKLDYLQDLGVTAIWLLPFYPSPLRDDGYDIADYLGVNPAYGTLRDFKRFIAEAHNRGLKVITELVVNHTSDAHPWFQRARQAPAGSRERDFYVWSDTPTRYPGVRIIFQDFESSNWSWDPVARAYYWHRFYSHQPDLNFDNPAVHDALAKVMDHWMDMGVDGVRLDAIPYLYEREGTSCENLPETHQYLKKLRAYVDKRHPGVMLLAEANQWPEDAISYFGNGDECHMAFHFPVMPRLFMAIRMEDRFPIVDILEQTPPIPDNCQWAMFLRNHDELTLEMVTDEERDYMYRVYAMDRQARINLGIRRRLAPLLGNSRRKIELMNALLFSLPGTPVLYYGDEIGMGDNVYLGDRDGVRTPMQWSGDRNAGFSRASPQRLYLPTIIEPEYHYETVNVEAQQNNPSSLLWWTKRLIALRQRYEVFGTGDIRFLSAANPKILAFVRGRADLGQHVLVVANLSRFVQAADIDLSPWQGMVPVEMFGRTKFPPIGDRRYFLTLGPHSFYWFSLEPGATPAKVPERPRATAPEIKVHEDLERWLRSPSRRAWLQSTLQEDIPRHRWFAAKARTLRGVKIIDEVPIRTALAPSTLSAWLVLVQAEYAEAEAELYAIPLAMASQDRADLALKDKPFALIAKILAKGGEEPRVLYDAVYDPAYCEAILDTISRKRRHRGGRGELFGTPTRQFKMLASGMESREVLVPDSDQSNSSVIFGHRFIMKLYRRVEPGLNPDLEVSRHLTEVADYPHTPLLAGALEYAQDARGEPLTIGLLQQFMRNQGDAWRYALDLLSQYYERVMAMSATGEGHPPLPPSEPLIELITLEPSEQALELLGEQLQWAALLGVRSAEMHIALARTEGDGAFAPEPFTGLYQRGLYQSMRNSAQQSLTLLRSRLETLPENVRADAEALLARTDEIMARLRLIKEKRIEAARIRCHGDYHLGQVLWTGKDFLIIDFEGEPSRSLGERRLKRSPMRDVAGMLRSLQYASYTALRQQIERGAIPSGYGFEHWEPQATFWEAWIGSSFLRSYLRTARSVQAAFLPAEENDLRLLLDSFLMDKALYEVSYELNSRPAWVQIPLRAIMHLLERTSGHQSESRDSTE